MKKIIPKVYSASGILSQAGFPADKIPLVWMKTKGKHKLAYVRACCGFDIETTNVYENNTAYMYIWQFALNDIVVIGRTWVEFVAVLERLKMVFDLHKQKRIIIWVANLGFEFQFIRHWLNITQIFAKEVRKPLHFTVDDCIEFRDCLAVSGGSLASLAKDYCITQKLVGDLDYSIIRNNETLLTQEELQYCINDVVILSEWSDYIFETYAEPQKYIPLTKTGILRKQIKQKISYETRKHIYEQYPETYQQYKDWMQYLFRGGYVHANICYVGKILSDADYDGGVAGVDITSSYPAQMNLRYYPVSKFRKVNPADLEQYLDSKCCIIKARFTGVKNRFKHSIESKSKVISVKNPRIDNGRILACDEMICLYTELDFKIFNLFYTAESIEILSLQVATRGRLPRYILDVLNDAYIQKDVLKKGGKSKTAEYSQYKSYVNSAYG